MSRRRNRRRPSGWKDPTARSKPAGPPAGLAGQAEQLERLALLCSFGGAFSECVSAARRALALDPGRIRAWNVLASSYLALGEPQQGRESYVQAVKAVPTSRESRMALLWALLVTGDYREGWRTWARENEAMLGGPLRSGPWPMIFRGGFELLVRSFVTTANPEPSSIYTPKSLP